MKGLTSALSLNNEYVSVVHQGVKIVQRGVGNFRSFSSNYTAAVKLTDSCTSTPGQPFSKRAEMAKNEGFIIEI